MFPAAPDEQLWFGIFRMGAWPEFYPGVQFPRDEASLDQFFRHMVPNVGPIDLEVNASAVSALVDRTGPAILITHSHSGGMGWRTAIKNQKVRAIVSFEPGSNFPFPVGEVPEPLKYTGGQIQGVSVPLRNSNGSLELGLSELPAATNQRITVNYSSIDSDGEDEGGAA